MAISSPNIKVKLSYLVYMVDSLSSQNRCLYLLNGPYSILFKAKLFIVCKFIYFVHFIHTCLFINYYKTIALTTGQITAKSSCSCSIKGTSQRRGEGQR